MVTGRVLHTFLEQIFQKKQYFNSLQKNVIFAARNTLITGNVYVLHYRVENGCMRNEHVWN